MEQIDINNSPVDSFRSYRGMFPTIARKIVDNAPYTEVEDVLKIPGLTDRQQEILQANLKNFTVTLPADVYITGDDNLNI